jgi:DHA2 family multidrug resistance protein-like MFS transporter
VTPAKATRREWTGLAVIALPCLLYSMDLTVLNLALPSLARELEPSGLQLLWIVDVYGFLVAGALITMGTLGDRIGRRRLLLVGAAFFGAASLAAAFAPSAEALIAARALLGLAGATIAPSTLSLIRNMFHDPHERTFAIGVWISAFSVGAAIGPLLGGVLLEFFWWGSVFLLALPVMVLLLAVGPFLLPEYRDPRAGRIDLPSAALALVAVLALIFGLKEMAQHGPAPVPLLSVVLSLFLGRVFVKRQKTLADPLIDLRLFRIPAFSASLVVYMLGTFVSFGIFIFMTQYLQLVLGLTPLVALTNDLIIGSVPPERAGSAAGISETVSELGGALGIALLGSLATAVYGAALAPATVLQGLELTAALSVAIVLAMIAFILTWLRPGRVAAP